MAGLINVLLASICICLHVDLASSSFLSASTVHENVVGTEAVSTSTTTSCLATKIVEPSVLDDLIANKSVPRPTMTASATPRSIAEVELRDSSNCYTSVCPDRFPVAHYKDSNPHNYTFDELFKLQTKLWDAFLYPNNVAQAKMINSTLFAEDVVGRIDVTRVFVGRELNTEYIFGLFSVRATDNSTVSLIGVPYAYQFQKFVANQNIASVASLVYIYYPILNKTLPLELDLWTVYDGQGKGFITEYDATFRYWDPLINATTALWGQHIGAGGNSIVTQAYLATNIVEGICNTHEKYCTGPNQQYSSFAGCLAHLGLAVRFGQPNEGGRDTVICRMIHQPMVSFRPEVHCPHIGPTGGGMCTDSPGYEQTVLEPIFKSSPFIPWGYDHQLNEAHKLGLTFAS